MQTFRPENFIWIKAISLERRSFMYVEDAKRAKDGIFQLGWPKHAQAQMMKPQIGEIIVIKQRLKQDENGGGLLTHAVSPADNEAIRLGNSANGWTPARRVKLLKLIPPSRAKGTQEVIGHFLVNGSMGACRSFRDYGLGDAELDAVQKRLWHYFFGELDSVDVAI